MAQTSYRYQPVFLGGAYWRLDISWKEDAIDDHTFIDEWTGPGYALPEQPTDEYTWMMISRLSAKTTSDGELLAIDNVDIQIGTDANTEAFLSPENAEAEIRLWWSADLVTWYPIFWGIVDQESVNPETEAVIGSTWVKRWSFTAYDCIRRLNSASLTDAAMLTNLATYLRDVSATGTHEVYIGNRHLLLWNVAWVVSDDPPPSAGSTSAQPYDTVIKMTYYLIESAGVAYPEHVHQSPANGGYLFHSTLGTSTILTAGAFEAETPPLPTAVEAEWYNWWMPYNVLGQGEFASDWNNLGEVVGEITTMIGCSVTTRHLIEAGGQWVRQLWYIPRSSVGASTITPEGVLMAHRGPGVRYEKSRVLVSTRAPEGGTPVEDAVAGTGDREVKLNVHLRTIDVLYPTLYLGWPEASGNRIRNVIWHCLLIDGSTTGRMQVANYVRVEGGGVYPFAQYGMWATRCYNGLAHAVANFYNSSVYNANTRIEEEYSRANATIGAVSSPANWTPGLKIEDAEDTAGTYRVQEYDMDIENNRVRIIKEKI